MITFSLLFCQPVVIKCVNIYKKQNIVFWWPRHRKFTFLSKGFYGKISFLNIKVPVYLTITTSMSKTVFLSSPIIYLLVICYMQMWLSRDNEIESWIFYVLVHLRLHLKRHFLSEMSIRVLWIYQRTEIISCIKGNATIWIEEKKLP